ncbi:hypothetical protein HZB94_01145 [Candidatus Falkowbacteria bacterium]|nr:hypothetical protein [Candidatus Falkowbacteria bacterium]
MRGPELLLCCNESAIEIALDDYFEKKDISIVTSIRFPAIQKMICDNDKRGPFIEDIKAVVQRRFIERIVIVAHENCKGYGGSQAFKSSVDEINAFQRDLWQAKRVILDEIAISYMKVMLLAAIKTHPGWLICEVKNEPLRGGKSSIGFLSPAIIHRAKRRIARAIRNCAPQS